MFVLDNKNSADPTFILFFKTVKDGRLKYSTRLKILPSNWKQGMAFPSDPKFLRECNEVNKTLDIISERYNSIPADKQTKDFLRHNFDAALGIGYEPRDKSMTDIIEEIIRDRQEGNELTKKGTLFSPGTTKNYRQTLAKLQEYELLKGRLYFETFTTEDCNSLLSWLNTKYEMSLSTLGRNIQELKALSAAARKRGYHNNTVMDNIDKVHENATDIYLDEEKILKIYNTVTAGINTRIKEWFVIGCFTGLRISDLSQLEKANIHKDFINLPNKKTGERVVIPLHWTVQEILKKYKGNFPPSVSDVKMNLHIKDIAKDAGLDGKVFYSMTISGKRKDFIKFEHEMISNHTGRRSFITNLLKSGFSESEVMKLAGIKESKTLQKYNKITHEEVAAKAATSNFFKKPSLKDSSQG